jgi:RimJ/RimL family protein N-acetyltransferase
MNQSPVFDGQRLRLTTFDLEADPAVIAAWTMDPAITQRFCEQPPLRLLAAAEVRKTLETWQKETAEDGRLVLFALRPQDEDRLVGFLRLWQVLWVHGVAEFDLVIGQRADWADYAGEALQLGLRYAFEEMNLFRVSVHVEEHDQPGRELYEAARFFLEVRQRQAVFRDGQYWDRLMYGMLRPEWATYARQLPGVMA